MARQPNLSKKKEEIIIINLVISEREDLTDTAMDNFSPQARWLQHKKNWSIVPSEIREKREKSATFLLVRKCAR